MLLIHKSVSKELLTTFFLSLLFLNFTLMMEDLMRVSRILSVVGAPMWDIAKIILYLQPQILIFTIPMAMLLSVLLTYGRMNADNELTILKASGMPFKNIATPVIYLGLACFAVSLAMSCYLGPKGNIILKETVSNILTTRAPMAIEEGIFNTAFKDVVILVKEKPSKDRLSGIFIFDERQKEEQRIIVAREGEIAPKDGAIGISMTDGSIYITRGEIITEINFDKYQLRLDLLTESERRKADEGMTLIELKEMAMESPERSCYFLFEFHKRLSIPALCLIVILLGPSLATMAGRSGKLGGFTIGISVFVGYYILLLYGESLVKAGDLPHFMGAWMPFIILGAFSIWTFGRISKK